MTLVIGVGNPDRQDDGAGPAVAARVADLALPGVRVIAGAEPTALLDLWQGEPDVIVVDAVRTAPSGVDRVLVLDVAASPLPAWAGSGGTHGFGVAGAVELARALGRLPRRLAVVGVVGSRFGDGGRLSADVAAVLDAAVQAAVDAAVEAVRARATGGLP
jgi:hydrogenase maturation protease